MRSPVTGRSPAAFRRLAASVVAGGVLLPLLATSPAGAATAPTRYLVTFAGSTYAASPAAVAALAAPLDALVATDVRPIGADIAVVTSSLSAARLAAAPNVASVELDRPLQLTAFGDEPGDARQWALANPGGTLSTGWPARAGADVDAARAWAVTTGANTIVAIGDTGVQLDHPDLAPNRWRNTAETSCTNGLDDDRNGYVDDCDGWDFGDGDRTPFPNGASNGAHGTHVAGIAAASRNGVGISGVAPGAKIMALKISNSSGILMLSWAAASIVYAANNGARVYNASWGGTGGSAALESAIAHARTKGMVIAAGAGNSALVLGGATQFYPAGYAATYDNVLSVASTDATDRLSNFSNRGAVTIAAPGSTIESTLPGSTWGTMSGTSMASPHVAGAAALVAAQHPEWAPAQIRNRLTSTTETDSNLALAGAGRLNAALALGAGPRSAPPASLPTISGIATPVPRQATVSFGHAIPTGVTGYTATATAPNGTVVATASVAPTARAVTLTGLAPSTTYAIRLVAATATGTLPASSNVTTPAWKVPPLPATGITIGQSGATLNVSWTLPADPVTKIVVRPSIGKPVTLKPGATSAQLPNPGRAGDLRVTVTLTNANGSTPASAATLVTASVPAAPPATVTARGAKAASVDWQAPDGWVTGYLVTFDGRTTKVAATKRTLAVALKRTGSFAVTVTAVNPFGPGTPTSLTLTVP